MVSFRELAGKISFDNRTVVRVSHCEWLDALVRICAGAISNGRPYRDMYVRRRANRLEWIYEIGSVFQSMHLRLFDSKKRRPPGREQKFPDSDSWAFVEPKPIGSGRPTARTVPARGGPAW